MTYEYDYSPEQRKQAAKRLKGLMAQNAFLDRELDARSFTILRDNGLMEPEELPAISQQEQDILLDPNHPDRISSPPGPILASFQDAGKPEASARCVEDLLFNPEERIRDAALKHFEAMFHLDPALLTKRTQSAIKAHAQDLRSQDPVRWRPAAVAIADTLRDDFLSNLAGMRQSVFLLMADTRYSPRVFRPSALALDKADVHIWKASTKQADMGEAIRKLIEESSSLGEACDRYYREFGYLPLAESLSMTRVIDEWLQAHDEGDVWSVIWAWADEIPSPLPRYHACTVFACKPSLVPAGKLEDLKAEITEIISLPGKEESDGQWSQAWRIRCELARHYVWHLEATFPGQDGELIASLSWWFAEQVALSFGNSPKTVEWLQERLVSTISDRSSRIWGLAHPPVTQSSLRYCTLFLDLVWSLSMRCLIGKLLMDQSEPQQADEGGIDKAVEAESDKLPLKDAPDESVYAFYPALLSAMETYSPEWLTKTLENLPSAEADEQASTMSTLMALAYGGILPQDLVSQFMADSGWRTDVLTKLDLKLVESLFHVITETMVQHGDKSMAQIPHFFANGCEEANKDKDRRKFLFAFTVMSCINSGNISAIRRLLRSRYKQAFVKHKDYWRNELTVIKPFLPAWLASRVRAVMASLHVD